MLNIIWMLLLGSGVICAALNGDISAVSEAALSAAQDGVQLCIELSGMLALWMGLFKIAEACGLIQGLGKLLTPLLRPLFPELPREHPALPLISLNLSANLLGLGNAATPLGLRAMAELQKSNSCPQRASAAMITLLVMNTSCITLFPSTVISLRSAAGSVDPAGFAGAAMLSSTLGFASALLLDRLFAAASRKKRRTGRC